MPISDKLKESIRQTATNYYDWCIGVIDQYGFSITEQETHYVCTDSKVPKRSRKTDGGNITLLLYNAIATRKEFEVEASKPFEKKPVIKNIDTVIDIERPPLIVGPEIVSKPVPEPIVEKALDTTVTSLPHPVDDTVPLVTDVVPLATTPMDFLTQMAYNEGRKTKKRNKPRKCYYSDIEHIMAFYRGYDGK